MKSDAVNMTDEIMVVRNSIRDLMHSLGVLNNTVNMYDVIDSVKNFEVGLIDSLLWNDVTRLSLYCFPKSDGVMISGNRPDPSGGNNGYWDNNYSASMNDSFLYLRFFSFDPVAEYGTHVLVSRLHDPGTKIDQKGIGIVACEDVEFCALPGNGVINKIHLPMCCL
jgi:hypothetical protein